MKKLLILLCFTLLFSKQDLNSFVQKALKHNMTLTKSQTKINEFKTALLESQGDLFPSLDISSRYTRAGGGRTIDFPIGDLLNPVYSGLHQLTNNPAYDISLENQEINFLRVKEHDTKISLTQIIDYRLWLIQDLQKEQVKLSQSDSKIMVNQIINEVIRSYLVLQKLERIKLTLKQNMTLLEENLKTSKALYKAKTVLKTNVLESELQIMALKKEILQIDKSLTLTQMYLNHLIDEDLKKEIRTETVSINFPDINRETLFTQSMKNRNEFISLRYSEKILSKEKSIKTAAYLPQLIVKADYGFQGESYDFSTKQDYWMISGMLKYNLFKGFSDQHAEEISEIKLQRLKIQEREVHQKIEIELDEAILNYRIQKDQIHISEKQLALANENFKIIEKKFKEGLSNQLEYMNAFTMKKNASISFDSDKIELILLKYKIDSVTGSLISQFN